MSVLVLTAAEVERLLPMGECIAAMERGLAALARGEAEQPLRMIFRPAAAPGLLALMPSYRRGGSFGLKTIGVFHGNPARGLDAHQGAVLLLSGETGELLALMNASAVTAIRTAAVSGLATRLLARPDAGDLAILGAGVQARSHLDAMACVRPIRRVRVASRRPERARAFAESEAVRRGFPVIACAAADEAVRGADLVVTATSSAEPVIRREWLSDGAHVNAIGASLPHARELDSATVAAARLFVDRRESARAEAGDYLVPLREGAIGEGHIRAELGELLTGAARGRTSPDEITVFKSLGLAVEDLFAAEAVYARARAEGAGTAVAF